MTTTSLDEGRQLADTEYGCSDGVPVVFLHGIPGSCRLGALFETVAREQGIRLLAFERPGYGYSTPWPSRSLRDAGTVVNAVLNDANVERAGLVAFSGGGPHALATAVTQPDRVTRVDVVSGAVPPDVSEEQPATQRLLSGLATRTPTLLRGLFRGQAWLAARLDPSLVVSQYTAAGGAESVPDDTAAIVQADFVTAFARHRSGAVTDFRNTASDWGINLDDLETDLCFWHGENDTNVPIDGVRRLAAQLPTAQLRVLDDADHLQTLLRAVPEVFSAHR
ncbi:alpha/beta fold hydrolase [Natrinema limicola]|uniref:Alpha/beta fold family hydrolase n=1 Tax=Natrinema limicola JCM 13563 TaxID=1230457 RepID=M0CCM0_9EURY|nr:alpha/beta hydrolase [Natrinema limicola]ELZ20393.1 alpha/beta fold family hydrolase [Natrinema limicola JCM 13563]